VAVIDRSGSMGGAKLEAVKKTIRMAAKHLRPQDRLALVTYDDAVERPLELTAMTESGKEKVVAAINALTDRGCTNLSGGLLEGLNCIAERRGPKNEVASVLLLTDGHANRGITDSEQLVAATKAKLDTMGAPCSVYTFGYGDNHNSSMLDSVANAGGASYFYVAKDDDIAEAFGDAMGGLMTVVAQNIKMEVSACEGVRIHSLTTSYKTTALVEGQRYRVEIGDMLAEEQRDILIDLAVPAATDGVAQQSLFHVDLKYFDVPALKDGVAVCDGVLSRTNRNTADGERSAIVEEQKARVEVTSAVEEARGLAERGDFARASNQLRSLKASIETKAWAAAYIQDLDEVSEAVTSRSAFAARGGSHMIMQKARKHKAQRSNECHSAESAQAGRMASANAYTSLKKRSMKKKFLAGI